MQYNNKSALATPIMNKVVLLNKQLAFYGAQLPHGKKRTSKDGSIHMSVDVRRGYLYPLLEKGNLLFVYAMRQLKGKDYLKRSQELIDEIQAQCYLILQLRRWCSIAITRNGYISQTATGTWCVKSKSNISREMSE